MDNYDNVIGFVDFRPADARRMHARQEELLEKFLERR